jgi:hypothetical protein
MADPVFGLIQLQVAPNVRHPFVSAIADSADVTLVRPVDWNAAHNVHPVPILSIGSGGGLMWAAMPAGLTEIFGSTLNRMKVDLTWATSVALRVNVSVVGAGTARLRGQYTTDLTGASGWAYLDGATGPEADISATGVKDSAFVTLTGAAKAVVLVRVVGING